MQRFAQNSLFKRTVLEHIAADLLSMHFMPDPTSHGASGKQTAALPGAPVDFLLRAPGVFLLLLTF